MRLWQEVKDHPIRFLKTTGLWSCFICLGMNLAIVGPTLLDLRQQVGSSIKEVSYGLAARAGGQAAGSLIMGFAYPYLNYQLAAAVSMILSSLLTLLVPHLTNISSLLVIFVLNGVCMGAFESGANVFILKLWGKETQPFMQSLHFMFGCGSLVAPLIAVPFLANTDEGNNNETNHNHISSLTNTSNPGIEEFHPERVQLVYPYSILAFCYFLSAVFILAIWFHEPETSPHPSRASWEGTKHEPVPLQDNEPTQELDHNQDNLKEKEEANDYNHPEDQSPAYKYYKILAIILTMMFMHAYLGLEISFGSYITTFVVKSGLPLTKSDGAHITTIFWAAFTLFRVLTIFYIQYIEIEVNVIGSLAIILLSNVFLLPFGDTSVTMLLIGVCLIGIGTSSVWACMFGYLEIYFPVTSFIGSLILISAVMGEFVFPFIISNYIDHQPRVLLWVTLFCSLSTSFLFLLIMIICRIKLKRPSIT